MAEVSAAEALAFRIAGHNLHRRTDPITAIAACGIQQTPPIWGGPVALQARSSSEPEARRVIVVNAMRGAPYLVPRADLAVFTRALVPPDDELKAMIGSRNAKEAADAGYTPREALDRIAAAAREGLAEGPLGRDDFHQAMRERLPEGLLPWCRGCQSHHVRAGFWRALGPEGVTRMDGKARYALAPKARGDLDRARAELVRRFLHCFGPATHSQLASWAQTSPKYAKSLFAAIEDELEQVDYEGRKALVLAADLKRLKKPPKATGVRMISGFDPYVSQPDREALVPEAKLRKRMFPAIGRREVILDRGRLAGLWRGRKDGSTLAIEVEWLGPRAKLGREPAAIAAARGCEQAELSETG
jgi:hypothetical protein